MDVLEIIQKILDIFAGLGFELIPIVIIVIIVQALKYLLSLPKKSGYILVLFIGATYGIISLAGLKIPPKDVVKIILGYPAFSVLLYSGVKAFMPKIIEKFTKKD